MARSRGEGTLFQRKDGRWQASLQVNGVRQTVYGKTRQEAARKLAELQRQARDQGGLPDPGSRTLNDLLCAWLEVRAPSLKETTLAHYNLLCNTYLRPTLGATKLSRLAPDRIQRLYSRLQKKGHHRTAQLVHCLLHQACGLAVRWGWLAEDPTQRTVRPAYRRTRIEVWDPEELRAFLDGARDHWLYPMWVLALATGCRLGELLGLTGENVDTEVGSLTITRSLQRVSGEYRLTLPKTRASQRVIALPHEAMETLAHHAEGRLRQGMGGGLVFTNTGGQPLHRSVVAHALKRECERLGIRPMTPHGLRHLHASLLLQQGLPVPLVSARLGHANSAITMSVYAHQVGSHDQAAAQAIGKALSQGRR